MNSGPNAMWQNCQTKTFNLSLYQVSAESASLLTSIIWSLDQYTSVLGWEKIKSPDGIGPDKKWYTWASLVTEHLFRLNPTLAKVNENIRGAWYIYICWPKYSQKWGKAMPKIPFNCRPSFSSIYLNCWHKTGTTLWCCFCYSILS